MTVPQARLLALAVGAVFSVSCGLEPDAPLVSKVPIQSLAAQRFANSEWSAPVNIGAPVNTTAGEMNAALSPDELSLYFTSNRTGGLGGTDIWVSHRNCADCAWQAPVNLGAPVNSASADAGPRLSIDGHLLFFQSDRPGGEGFADIYLSRRNNTNDDLGWGDPLHLGTDVNTSTAEQAADYLQSAEDGVGNLYFNRGIANATDIYYAAVKRNGETRGPAVLVTELSDPIFLDQHASVRKDGREVFLASLRLGGFGGFDLWTSTRDNVHAPWTAPVNPGPSLNTAANEMQPSLTGDGRTLLFTSDRPGGLGANDLWISTRTTSGH